MNIEHRYSLIAQLVERRTVNPCVAGSSPAGGARSYAKVSIGVINRESEEASTY